ncbi:BgTH12-06346 [Blumeria graminis f. sp. triticale]|uniref:BgTH12-06346 n=1 Tax=Blumeria graminis f. sp. triticale TaxID=1689686 RepID=A0A9W4CYD7_BLUGR|nr:BgTH12-06346 [Blumeria graminis f. sp. triticale]
MPYVNNGGGTLTLPSPTHVHHVDVTSAVRSLRRSLSKSPSKFRLVTAASSPSPKSPLSPSPLSPNPAPSTTNSSSNLPHTPSPLAVPFPPSVKLALRSSSRIKPSQSRQSPRARTSPKSPYKRNTTRNLEAHTVVPSLCTDASRGLDSIVSNLNAEKTSSTIGITHPINPALTRLGIENANEVPPGAQTSSPLKRNDTIMNLDQASLGSPVAKRRSLHGSGNFGHDFNIFDHGPSNFEPHEEVVQEYELSSSSITAEILPYASLPRRSSSLRKSTLQQRHGEKTSWGRRHAAQILAAQQAANSATTGVIPEVVSTSHTKNRPRLSLDQFMPPLPRDSPFSTQVGLLNASVHALNQSTHQPHPLSRTITTSSSSSNNLDESPTHAPIHTAIHRRSKPDFSKSMPAGALRPFKLGTQVNEDATFVTPQNFRSVKPLPAAFVSTGLISKVNRNPEDPLTSRGANKNHVPDTPCKKHVNGFATYPAPVPGSAIAKARHIRHSFGAPSTPFNPHLDSQSNIGERSRATFGGVFGGRGMSRRSSLLSLDSEDSASPELKCDIQSVADLELPPTPTKQSLIVRQENVSPSSNRNIPASFGGHDLVLKLPKQSVHVSSRTDFLSRLSPHTPLESPSGATTPPDPSGLSISHHLNTKTSNPCAGASMPPPATPTAGREHNFKIGGALRMSSTPVSSYSLNDIDASLASKFEKVEMIGTGEFSQVFRVTERPLQPGSPSSNRIFAVKKTRHPFQGIRDRERKIQEVNILRALGDSDYIVHLLNSWEEKNHLYIQTEFCEEGSMDLFLSQVGRKGRLDDFRIWKILLELGLGLKHIHDKGFIHLDLKPANILITFEGVLKIADFGMATSWPAPQGIEGEGDREYIGPEILEGNYDKPADVFALGLIMLEIAGNVQLPDNGPTWQRLRSGDVSDVPSLTCVSDCQIRRDATGIPLDESDLNVGSLGSDDELETEFSSPTFSCRKRSYGRCSRSLSHDPSNLFGSMRRGELHKAPQFMKDQNHPTSLDQLVRWMITPNPQGRPVVHQVLESEGVSWVETRRRAGATVYEGNWGPADEALAVDTEMGDV